VADPTMSLSGIPLLTPDEAHRQLVEWNATATETPPVAIYQLVEEQSARFPDAPAVSVGGQVISGSELHRRTASAARRLRAAGVGPGDVVALLSEVSIDLIVGMLGVLKVGAAYLLLDPSVPLTQLDFMVANSAAVALLAAPSSSTRLTDPPELVLDLAQLDRGEPSGSAVLVGAAPGAVCCVQYSSHATTGPNGVLIRHDSVVNVAQAMATELDLGPADTVLVLPAAFFNASVTELLAPLVAGARIVVAAADAAADGAVLSRLIAAERVNFLHAQPRAWQALIDTGLRPTRGLRALSGGESLSVELADQILDRCRTLWNTYGKAETTFYSTLGRIERSAPINIGRPIANTRAYVLDRDGRPAAVGVTGELLLAGDGLAPGYADRPERAAEMFVADPFAPGRAYRTGDAARWLPDGRLQLVGPE
jgi:amino acid adenylation domain-containing protein